MNARLLGLSVLLVLACKPPKYIFPPDTVKNARVVWPAWKGALSYPVVADGTSKVLLSDAITWSRKYGLETGGCFDAQFVRDTIFVTGVVENVRFRKPLRVGLSCRGGGTRGIWHTHWHPESDSTVGCNIARATDLYLIGRWYAVGLVVCGVGADSTKPYTYDPSTEPVLLEAPPPDPPCFEEPTASRRRGGLVRCRRSWWALWK